MGNQRITIGNVVARGHDKACPAHIQEDKKVLCHYQRVTAKIRATISSVRGIAVAYYKKTRRSRPTRRTASQIRQAN